MFRSFAAQQLARRVVVVVGGGPGGAVVGGKVGRARSLHGDTLWMQMSSSSTMRGTPPPTHVHTVTGNDAKGVISKVLDAVCAQGGTVVSSRSVRMGGKSKDDNTHTRPPDRVL